MKRLNGKRLVPTLTFGRVIGGAAVLLLVSAGTAYAANEWTGANIVDGSLTTDDIANNSIQGTDIATGTDRQLGHRQRHRHQRRHRRQHHPVHMSCRTTR